MGGAITIRQVTSMDRKLEVRERMKRRYAFKNYPDEFTFRCKCIIVFQNLDGVDAILFGLYVYEHDETNPAPNTRTVYVSYLDSVHYMRPRNMRTLIYHEILIAYLDYVRDKGFSTAHIWACPPLKGDDYILYAKPEDQKTPRDDRLRQWYVDMLVECQKRGIVGKLTNMYDLYFADEKNDAAVVPYMDGDYFPAEAENIIKDIEEGKSGKKATSAGKKKTQSKAKSKKKSGRGGTRSTGLDEDALAASGIFPQGMQQKSLEEGGRDYVMAKLGDTIQPMKESFIVAFLAWKGAKLEDMVVSKEIQEYRDKHGIVSRHLLQDTAGDDGSENANNTDANDPDKMDISESAASNNSEPDEKVTEPSSGEATMTDATAADASQIPEEQQHAPTNSDTPAAVALSAGDTAEAAPKDDASEAKEPSGDEAKDVEEKKDDVKPAQHREGKFAAMAARKRDLEGNVKETEPAESEKKPADEKTKDKASESLSKRETVRDANGRLVQVIDDDKEEMDCEFLNNRQAFLNLCQGNHYQFDSLRRCKHSSMMVLWHLHNRDAPKFVQQCAICSREILAGYRYHCPICADYDQCHDCVSNPSTPRHPHQLKPIAVASGQQNELTEAQRKERQRSIQLHMTLLLHAATCSSSSCPSANCTKMKGLLKHGAQCQVKATGGCHVCKRIWALLQLHARQCQATACPVPNCMAIRERFRQLKKQQQAMDDRRRQEMNRHYQRGS
jgi:E1A/CREB-binding protein